MSKIHKKITFYMNLYSFRIHSLNNSLASYISSSLSSKICKNTIKKHNAKERSEPIKTGEKIVIPLVKTSCNKAFIKWINLLYLTYIDVVVTCICLLLVCFYGEHVTDNDMLSQSYIVYFYKKSGCLVVDLF